jgi:hypothetical protein
MNPTEIKILLLRKSLTVAGIARALGTRRDMVSQLFNQLRYYPTLAKKIEKRYGIVCPQPSRATKRKKAA